MEWTSTVDRLPVLDVRWDWLSSGRSVYSATLPLNSYATDQWRTGEVLQSKYDFRLPISVPDGKYALQFQVIDQAAQQPIGAATRLATVNVASRLRSFAIPDVQYPLGVMFGDLAKLVGANAEQAGGAMTVTLFWQAQALTTTNYTTSAQLIGSDGNVAQQIDRWQIGFDAPTNTWVLGQVIADQYVFEVSSGGPQIGIGVYDAATGERLPAYEAGRRLPQDRVMLQLLSQ
jgi:hypothetical protein